MRKNILVKVGDLFFVFNTNKTAWIAVTEDAVNLCKMYSENEKIMISDLNDEQKTIYDALVKLDEMNEEYDPSNNIKSCYIHVTQDCNLKCPYCYSKNKLRNKHMDLSVEEWQKGITIIKDAGFERLVFSGGEPLMYHGIDKILEYCKHIGYKEIDLISNGLLVNDENIIFLKKYVDNLCISLDGYDEETNSPTRGKNNFDKVIENIAKLRRNLVPVNIIATIYKDNIELINKYIELATSIDCTISFSLFTLSGEALENQYLEQDENQLSGLTDYLLDDQLPELVFDNIPVVKGITYREGCGAGSHLLSINADGSVYPCHFMMQDALMVGNIITDSIESILSQANKHTCAMKIDNIAECNECDYKYLCGGGCRANAYKGFGRIKKSSDCEFYKSYYGKILSEII